MGAQYILLSIWCSIRSHSVSYYDNTRHHNDSCCITQRNIIEHKGNQRTLSICRLSSVFVSSTKRWEQIHFVSLYIFRWWRSSNNRSLIRLWHNINSGRPLYSSYAAHLCWSHVSSIKIPTVFFLLCCGQTHFTWSQYSVAAAYILRCKIQLEIDIGYSI